MTRNPIWLIAIGGTAFGEGAVFLHGFLLLCCLLALSVGYAVFQLVRPVFRAIFPRRVKVNECSPELLAYWKPVSDRMRRNGGQFFEN